MKAALLQQHGDLFGLRHIRVEVAAHERRGLGREKVILAKPVITSFAAVGVLKERLNRSYWFILSHCLQLSCSFVQKLCYYLHFSISCLCSLETFIVTRSI